MNTYRRHTDTHSARTAHLSLLEEGAYNRLLDWQYSNESPLPPTYEELHRITRATTAPERRATDKIATVFFAAEGWNPRAREEIEPNRPRVAPARSSEPLVIPQASGVENLLSLLAPQNVAPPESEPEPKPEEAPPAPEPAPATDTPAEEISAYGLRVLTTRRVSAGPAHNFLAHMRKHIGDQGTMELLRACEQECSGEPRSWLQRAMLNRSIDELICKLPPRSSALPG